MCRFYCMCLANTLQPASLFSTILGAPCYNYSRMGGAQDLVLIIKTPVSMWLLGLRGPSIWIAIQLTQRLVWHPRPCQPFSELPCPLVDARSILAHEPWLRAPHCATSRDLPKQVGSTSCWTRRSQVKRCCIPGQLDLELSFV